jgi:nicotinamide mononucleotide transporter
MQSYKVLLNYIIESSIFYIELSSVILALFNCFLGMKQKVATWPVNIVISLLNLIVYYRSKLYDKCFILIISIIFSIYGWNKWLKGRTKGKELPVSKTGNTSLLAYLLICLLAAPIIKLGLQYLGAHQVTLSAFRTSLWFLGMLLTANKKLENYIIWGIMNILSMIICYYQELYLFALKYGIYFILSIYGYITWYRDYTKKTNNI